MNAPDLSQSGHPEPLPLPHAPSCPADRIATPALFRRERSAQLFTQLRETTRSDAERSAVRDELVRLHLGLVEHCARRFADRGETHEDLVQVGTIGLLKAIDRFEPERGFEFSTYAVPTVLGEIKRHFRDTGWAIRVPRRLQERRMRIQAVTGQLTQTLGRSPTPEELAGAAGCTVEEVLETLESANAYSTLSLDASAENDAPTPALIAAVGFFDERLDHVEIRESVRPLLEQLEPRERKIVVLRFFANMSQSQIASEVGISQMHVSRLLGRTLDQMRAALTEPSH